MNTVWSVVGVSVVKTVSRDKEKTMKFKDYLKKITKLADDHPELMDSQVVYSRDEEGNHFSPVYYSPSVGLFDDGEYTSGSETLNAVCIN